MLDKNIMKELEEYIKQHISNVSLEEKLEVSYNMISNSSEVIPQDELEDFIKANRKPTLNQVLFEFIDRKGYRDAEVYKKAGIDRRLFSKIRSNTRYHPGKKTMIALALALALSKEETETLLSCAGYSLSDSETFDLVILFFLERKIYDVDYVNQALDHYGMKLLVGSGE